MKKPVFRVSNQFRHKLASGESDWLSGRASDSGAKGLGFETYLFRVLSLSKTLYSPKVLVIPRKQWLHPDMTEKLLTGTLSLNTNEQTNWPVQPQKMARGLKIYIKKVEGLCYLYSKNKALISCAVTVQLICGFVFAYAKIRFSHDAAEI